MIHVKTAFDTVIAARLRLCRVLRPFILLRFILLSFILLPRALLSRVRPSRTPPMRSEREMILLLILATAIGPITMSFFLPALPDIQADLGISIARAGLTVSVPMGISALAALFYGPLSDRFGRRPVLVGSICLGFCGAVLGALAPNFWLVLFARFVQVIGNSAGFVLGRVIVQDYFGKEKAGAKMGAITAAMVIAPIIGPTLGGFVAEFTGWRGNFIVMAVIAAMGALTLYLRLPETNSDRDTQIRLVQVLVKFSRLIKNPDYVRYAVLGAALQAPFFAFLVGSPFIAIRILGLSESQYGLAFSVMPIGFLLAGLLAMRKGEVWGNDGLVLRGTPLAAIGALCGLLALAGIGWTTATLFLPLVFVAFGNALALTGAQAACVANAGRHPGAGSSLFSFLQMIVATLVTQLTGTLQGDATPYPTSIIVLVIALFNLVLLVTLRPAIMRPRNP